MSNELKESRIKIKWIWEIKNKLFLIFKLIIWDSSNLLFHYLRSAKDSQLQHQHYSLDDARVILMLYQEMENAEAVSSQYIMGVGITNLINRKNSN